MFTTYLFEHLSHLKEFYSTEQEFIAHMISGEVKVPISEFLTILNDYDIKSQKKTEKACSPDSWPKELEKLGKKGYHISETSGKIETIYSDPLENCRVIEGIFQAYAKIYGIEKDLSMCNSGRDINFCMYSSSEGGKGEAQCSRSLNREWLQSLNPVELTETILANIEEVAIHNTLLPSAHQYGTKVKVFLMPEGEESFPGFTGVVTGVHFYRGKVKYDVEIKFYGEMSTRIYNVDSVLVHKNDIEKVARLKNS